MPAFIDLVQRGKKRPAKGDHDSGNRKRRSLGNPGDEIANDPTKVGEQYWMVQWYASANHERDVN